MAIPYSRTIAGSLPWYSVLIVTGILLAIWLAEREQKRLGLPDDTVIDLALVVVPCGIVGARLYYVAMTWQAFASNPISILYIWEGGIAIYGAVLGGALGAFVYAQRKKLSVWRLFDICVPGLLLAQAIGRWGNYFNMEAFGPVITDPRFQFFPLGVLIPQGETYVWHMATFFYESMWNLCGFAALWTLRKHEKQAGSLFCWYLLIYGSGRFIIEGLREDSLYLGTLRVSQLLSLILCAAAALALLYRALNGNKMRLFGGSVCAVLWLARWFCLETPALYAVFAATAFGLALLRLLREKRVLTWLLCAAFIADGLGWLAAVWLVPLSAAFAGCLHALLCSVTLPVYVASLTRDA